MPSERLFPVAALLQGAEGVDQTQCTESYFLNHHGDRVQVTKHHRFPLY